MTFESPRQALTFYAEVINRHRFDDLLPVLSPDVVFWFSSGSHEGIDAARQAFEAVWARIADETYSIDDVRWVAEGDQSACCVYRFEWEGWVEGQRARGGGRGTTVLAKSGNDWLIVHEHLSAHPT